MPLFVSLILFFLSAVVAVFIPQAVPVVLIFVYRLLDLGVPYGVLFVLGASAATLVTACLWYFDIRIHAWISKKMSKGPKNLYVKKFHEWFTRTFTFNTNIYVLFALVTLGSMSIIPDIILIEFARKKMNFAQFITAAGLGKCITYMLLIGGATGLLTTVM